VNKKGVEGEIKKKTSMERERSGNGRRRLGQKKKKKERYRKGKNKPSKRRLFQPIGRAAATWRKEGEPYEYATSLTNQQPTAANQQGQRASRPVGG